MFCSAAAAVAEVAEMPEAQHTAYSGRGHIRENHTREKDANHLQHASLLAPWWWRMPSKYFNARSALFFNCH